MELLYAKNATKKQIVIVKKYKKGCEEWQNGKIIFSKEKAE